MEYTRWETGLAFSQLQCDFCSREDSTADSRNQKEITAETQRSQKNNKLDKNIDKISKI